jgi:hypothetical protein
MTSQNLHDTNRRLRGVLEELSHSDPAPATIGPRMELILTELLRVGGWLQSAAAGPADRELQEEINQYRQNLELLQTLLPEIQARLLTERARLESERSHLEAANAGVRASRRGPKSCFPSRDEPE